MTDYWFLIRSKHHSGDVMDEWRKGLEEAGIETYYPMVRELRRLPLSKLSHAQRRSGVELKGYQDGPLLPRHVFIGQGVERVLSMRGVVGFVTMNDRPMACPSRAIELLRKREVDGVILGETPWERLFREGDAVEVSNGPLSSFSGNVEVAPDLAIQELDPDVRLKLTLNVFGQFVRVEIRASDVVRVKPGSHPGSHAASHAIDHGVSAKRVRDSNPA